MLYLYKIAVIFFLSIVFGFKLIPKSKWPKVFKSNSASLLRSDSQTLQLTRQQSISSSNSVKFLPRLAEDIESLLSWVTQEGGYVNAKINKTEEGWTLVSSDYKQAGEVVVSIPKKICIFSNFEDYDGEQVPLLGNTIKLMSSIDTKQWRVRLAIALLSERVRPNSYCRSYIRNLPFEFFGVPMFFNSSIFSMIQDLTLIQRNRERCRFLLEFTNAVLVPLRLTSLDPFLGQQADVNSFGWAFAAAASRAIRHPNIIKEGKSPVIVPIIDVASHDNKNPSCVIVDNGDEYQLRATRNILKGRELTIDYGPLSNDDLFTDYGFTIDDNQYDKFTFNADSTMIDTARIVMGQSTASLFSTNSFYSNNNNNNENKNNNDTRQIKIGRGGEKFDERWLHNWQRIWLQSMDILGPNSSYAMTISITDDNNFIIDPKLWAFLRVIYSTNENDLLKHGYDPILLQNPASLLAPEIELPVIRTMIGMITILLRMFPIDENSDLKLLENGKSDDLPESTFGSDDILLDVYRLLKGIIAQKVASSKSSTSTLSPKNWKNNKKQTSTDSNELEDALRVLNKITSILDDTNNVRNEKITSFVESLRTSNSPFNTIISTTKNNNSINKIKTGDNVEDSEDTNLKVVVEYPDENELQQSVEDIIKRFKFIVDEDEETVTTSEALQQDNSNNNDIIQPLSETRNSELDLLGAASQLPWNVRELLKYRIRKKRMLTKIILRLIDYYQMIAGSDFEALLPPIPATSGDGRKARIKELLSEAKYKTIGSKDEAEVLANLAKISSKWIGKNAVSD